jgi:hypothetical protein
MEKLSISGAMEVLEKKIKIEIIFDYSPLRIQDVQ